MLNTDALTAGRLGPRRRGDPGPDRLDGARGADPRRGRRLPRASRRNRPHRRSSAASRKGRRRCVCPAPTATPSQVFVAERRDCMPCSWSGPPEPSPAPSSSLRSQGGAYRAARRRCAAVAGGLSTDAPSTTNPDVKAGRIAERPARRARIATCGRFGRAALRPARRPWSSSTSRTTSPIRPAASRSRAAPTSSRRSTARSPMARSRPARSSSSPRTGTRRRRRTSPRTAASGRSTASPTRGARSSIPTLDAPPDAPRVRKGANGEDGYSGFTMRDPVTGETKPDRARGDSSATAASSTSSSAASRPTTASTRRPSTRAGSASRRSSSLDAMRAVDLEPGRRRAGARAQMQRRRLRPVADAGRAVAER